MKTIANERFHQLLAAYLHGSLDQVNYAALVAYIDNHCAVEVGQAGDAVADPLGYITVHNSMGECTVSSERLCPELPVGRHPLLAHPQKSALSPLGAGTTAPVAFSKEEILREIDRFGMHPFVVTDHVVAFINFLRMGQVALSTLPEAAAQEGDSTNFERFAELTVSLGLCGHRENAELRWTDDLGKLFRALAAKHAVAASVQAQPQGWVFSTADFSVRAAGANVQGSVTLIRDLAGRAAWHALSEEYRELYDLYCYGFGMTINEALSDAARRAEVLPSIPSPPVKEAE